MSAMLAALHYIALALGFAGILIRLRGLRQIHDGNPELAPVYFGDNLWGAAAGLWLITGLLRAFGGFEKGTEFYLHSHWFYLRMILFVVVVVLEIYPMTTLIRWRMKKMKTSSTADIKVISRMKIISMAQLHLIALMPFVASIMARGGFK